MADEFEEIRNKEEQQETTVSETQAEQKAPQPDLSIPFFLREDPPETTPSVVPEERPPAYMGKPEGISWGDFFYSRREELSPRHREVARLLWLGKSNKEIAGIMGYEPARITFLKQQSDVRAEVERLHQLAFERSVNDRLKDMGPQAMNVIEQILAPKPDAGIKLKDRKDTAIWLLEKLTGKPKQEFDHQSSTLTDFMSMLEKIQEQGIPIDITPQISASPPQSEVPAGESTDARAETTGTRSLSPAGAEAEPQESEAQRWVRENLP